MEIRVFKTGCLFYSNLSTGWSTLASITQRINFMIPMLYLRISLVTVITRKQKVKLLERESTGKVEIWGCSS